MKRIYFLTFVPCAFGCCLAGMFDEKILWTTFVIVALFSGTYFWAKKNQKKKKISFIEKFAKRNSEAKDSLKESLKKAKKDYKILQDLNSQIADDEVAWRLTTLQQVAEKILQYLEQNPERISAAEEFIEIYQDKAVGLVRQYLALEKTHFSSSEMSETKARINKTLSSLLATYKAEFKRILDYQLMDLNAELDVFQSFMKEQPQKEENTFPEELKENFFHERRIEKKKSSSKEDYAALFLREIKFNKKSCSLPI